MPLSKHFNANYATLITPTQIFIIRATHRNINCSVTTNSQRVNLTHYLSATEINTLSLCHFASGIADENTTTTTGTTWLCSKYLENQDFIGTIILYNYKDWLVAFDRVFFTAYIYNLHRRCSDCYGLTLSFFFLHFKFSWLVPAVHAGELLYFS